MFSFLHAADLHLDSPLVGLDQYEGAPVDEIRGASRRALENLVRLAIARDVKFVLLSGDIYDGDWPDYSTGLFFLSALQPLREAKIPVYLISGNHDAASRITRQLRLPAGEVVRLAHDRAETVSLDDLGVALHGQSYATQAVVENLSAAYPRAIPGCFNIGLLHTCFGQEGHHNYAPCTADDLQRRGYQYWALGHIHKRCDETRLQDGSPAVFPGNLQGRHIKETGPKGCVVVTVDDGQRVASVGFEPLDVLRWEHVEIDVTHHADSEEVCAAAAHRFGQAMERSGGRTLAARVTLRGEYNGNLSAAVAAPERLLNELRSEANLIGGGRLWLERVVWKARRREDRANMEGPLAELASLLGAAEQDDAALAALADDLQALEAKLPEELRTADAQEPFSLKDPGLLREILAEVGPLLQTRLSV